MQLLCKHKASSGHWNYLHYLHYIAWTHFPLTWGVSIYVTSYVLCNLIGSANIPAELTETLPYVFSPLRVLRAREIRMAGKTNNYIPPVQRNSGHGTFRLVLWSCQNSDASSQIANSVIACRLLSPKATQDNAHARNANHCKSDSCR